MREIKFRQFIGDFGFHYWGNGPHEDGAKWKGPCSGGGGGKEYPSYQYTGLKDKNGVEIYEGDILKCIDVEFGSAVETLAVKYNPGGFVLYNPNCCERCKDGDGCVSYLSEFTLWTKHWSVEVIGNIHENPELLAGEE